jgi:LacI family transcriptional regulator
MSIRIKDIAARADVSIATVSLVLNNKPGVADETRQRVIRIADEMNYLPRRPTSLLDRGTIRFLKIARHGHTVNRDHTVFISDYIEGIVRTAKRNSFKTEITTFETTPIEEIVRSVSEPSDLVGAIVLGTELSRDDVVAFADVTIPLVFLDTFLDYIPFDFVDMNNDDSVYKIVTHFIERGHTSIGMVSSPIQTRNFTLRKIAFWNVMRHLDLPIEDQHLYDVDSTFHGAYTDMKRYIESNVSLPTALFCTNDIIAFGVLKALREARVRIPDDVSVIGFDDLPTAALLDPPLTSIAVSKLEIGSAAATRLFQRIEQPELPPTKIVVGGMLMERKSVAAR